MRIANCVVSEALMLLVIILPVQGNSVVRAAIRSIGDKFGVAA